MNKKILFVFFICFLTFASYAKSLSLQVIQRNGDEEHIHECTMLIEQAIMDYFFEHNDIISNSPTSIYLNEADSKAASEKNINEAIDGSIEYFIELTLCYDKPEHEMANPFSLSNVKKINWTVINLSTNKPLVSGSFSKIDESKTIETETGIEEFAYTIAENINKEIIKAVKK